MKTANPDDARVRGALSRYAAAQNNPDMKAAVQQMGAVFPSYPARQWARQRRGYTSYSMSIDLAGAIRYSADGQTATMVAVTKQQYQLIGGSPQQRSVRMEFRLSRAGNGWIIASAESAK